MPSKLLVLAASALLFSFPASPVASSLVQQGGKLVGTGAVNIGGVGQGSSVSVSGDGNTAIVGGPYDNNGAGGAWIYARNGSGVWGQQTGKLVGTGAVGGALQGDVAVSADGNTAIVGGSNDQGHAGAVWVYVRSGTVWSQQGAKLVGTGAVGPAGQGISVALSADGNTAFVGGEADNGHAGATWVYTRSGGVWSQQGAKLVGADAVGGAFQGVSVAVSADGSTALVGGYFDDNAAGAAWVFVATPALDVQSPATMAFALDPLPNPSPGGRLSVSFSLQGGERATLEVIDVSGRRAEVREVGSLGAGRHTLDLGTERRFAAGIYFVRLVQGRRMATARVAVLE